VKPQIDRAVESIKKFQFLDEKDPTYGGIGYGSDKTRSDLSNTQYALASLRAAGVPPSDPAFQRALTYLSRVQNRKENETFGEPTSWKDPKSGKTLVRSNDGGANYLPGDSKAGFDERPDGTGVLRSYGSMTYALLRCYHLAGLDGRDGRVQAAVGWVSRNWVLDRNPGMSEEQRGQGLYYYYATMAKALPLGNVEKLVGPEGRAIDWKAELAGHLLREQRPDGSWLNPEPRWMESMPVLTTAYALQALAPCVK
jgi:squalene-hopene/tetraprenyl-beta-curcumene cyclase